MTSTDDIIAMILDSEGAEYTDDPDDRGGPTKFGITQGRLSDYRGHDCSPDDVRDLTVEEATQIYDSEYIVKPGFLKITNDALRAFLVDWGVNSGTGTAIKAVQRRTGCAADGALGPRTAAAINAADASALLGQLIDDREAFYRSIVARDPSQRRFLAGWLARNNRFR